MNTDTPTEYSPPEADPALDPTKPTNKRWSKTTHYLLPVICYCLFLLFLYLGPSDDLPSAFFNFIGLVLFGWAVAVGFIIGSNKARESGLSTGAQFGHALLGISGQIALFIASSVGGILLYFLTSDDIGFHR